MKNKNTKIIIEMFLIFFCLGYLLNIFFGKFPKSVNFILPITIFFTGLEFMIKYIKEVHAYKYKYNILKVSISIYSIYIMFLSFLYILNKLNTTFFKVYIASIIVFAIFMIYYIGINIKKIIKEKNNLFINATRVFFTLLSLTFISICLLKIL